MPFDTIHLDSSKKKEEPPYEMYGMDLATPESVIDGVTKAIHIALELKKPEGRTTEITEHLRSLAQTFQKEWHKLLVHPDYINSTNLRLIVAELGISTQKNEFVKKD